MSVNIQKLPTPTADQTAAGCDGRAPVAELVPTFAAANKPAGATDAAWNEGRTTMEKVAENMIFPRRQTRCGCS